MTDHDWIVATFWVAFFNAIAALCAVALYFLKEIVSPLLRRRIIMNRAVDASWCITSGDRYIVKYAEQTGRDEHSVMDLILPAHTDGFFIHILQKARANFRITDVEFSFNGEIDKKPIIQYWFHPFIDAVARPRDDRQKDLLRPALEEIIDLGHPLVRLAHEIDWGFLDRRFASVCAPGPGQPGLPTRLVAGLFILKHMHNLSDEVLCARWLENPYYQFFCGELSFCHRLPFDRSSLTHWRQRLGEEQLVALIQESLSVAHKTGALATRDLERVVVDTTVQPKAIAHPTDARLCHRALEKLVDLARRHDVPLRQSYRRVAKRAAIMVGRYSHAHQFKRARRQLKFLRIRLGRVIRDIRRKIAGNEALQGRFAGVLRPRGARA